MPGPASMTAGWAYFAKATGPLDEPTLARARLAVLDLLGATLAGSATEVGRIAAGYATGVGGPPEAQLLGHQGFVGAAQAALANGIAGHVLELDDGHASAAGHPGVVVLPSALALGDRATTYGELLRAVVLGYELFATVGAALNPAHLQRGFHTTATVGPLAAALAGSTIAGLDVTQTTAALGLAGLQAAGLFEAAHGGHGAKPFQVGRATSAGVVAVQLALRGLAGPDTVLEGAAGLLRAMGDGGDAGPPARTPARWSIHDAYTKRHPACRHTHPVLDLALELSAHHPEDLRRIDRVIVETYATAVRSCGVRDPVTAEQTRFSLAFLAATALTRGRVDLRDLAVEATTDPEVRALAHRVSVSVADDIEAQYPSRRGARVTLVLADQRRVTVEQFGSMGDPASPLAQADFERKFDTLAGTVLPAARVADLRRAVLTSGAGALVDDVLASLGRLRTAKK